MPWYVRKCAAARKTRSSSSSARILTRVPFTSKATARMSMTWVGSPRSAGRRYESRRPDLGRSGGLQHPRRLPHEPAAVVLADVAVARDPQQVQRHVVRRAGGNRLERLLAVGEMTAV